MLRLPDRDNLTRRSALRRAGGILLAAGAAPRAWAAADFWNKKLPGAWSEQEIAQLTARSPWAHEVNAEFELDSDYTTAAAAGPAYGRGGVAVAPGTGSAAPAQIEIGRDRNDNPGGARRREPVTVRWESAQPIRDARGIPVSGDFDGRYVLSVSGLPLGVMERPRRGAPEGSADPRENTPAGRQRRMIEQMQNAATLEAWGREPEQPGLVRAVPRTPGTYLFGFSKELLALTVSDRDVLFTLKTALISVRAKFEPKEMLYRGHLAL